jgi:DMSO reductase anchor subunit
MNPALSVIFLTTLIGAGQGLFIAIVSGQPYQSFGTGGFGFIGSVVSLGLLILGLLASFFHLGRPERAWRAATKWKTSWLSREVIVLPLAMLIVFIYGLLHWQNDWSESRGIDTIGWLGIVVMLALYICTGMIYACVKFLQEWSTPWTLVNFTLLGTASGFVLASALSVTLQVPQSGSFLRWALVLTTVGMATRLFSFYRNSRTKPKSNIQSAIGIKHRHITQRSMGHTGGSFNTRAFFHHCSNALIRNIRLVVIVMVFIVPILLLLLYRYQPDQEMLWAAFGIQFAGLLAERWLFFAQADHPQNLYYQTVG